MKFLNQTLFALLLMATSAQAQSYFTGTTLLKRCSSEAGDENYQMDAALCIGYVAAIKDASQCGISVNGISSSTPKGAKIPQLVKVVVKWLNANPERLHLTAETLVAWALHDAYPCP